jgi:hypothetical protein
MKRIDYWPSEDLSETEEEKRNKRLLEHWLDDGADVSKRGPANQFPEAVLG